MPVVKRENSLVERFERFDKHHRAFLKVQDSCDALFLGSVGRVDFPHSNGPQLMRNIHANLMTLPDDTTVYSGHGPTTTTIGHERKTNPYILHGI